MIQRIGIEGFKSIEKAEIELGRVNVLIGANGSGKSNVLEAIGVLSATADGKVNDQVLLQRGVRPGVPALYKSAFKALPGRVHRSSPHISLGGSGEGAAYQVTLHNPIDHPEPSWRYKTELWTLAGVKIEGRSPRSHPSPDPEQGLVALRAVERPADDPAKQLLSELQGYAIFAPSTLVLRGLTPESQPRGPVGLAGGLLPEAIRELLRLRSEDAHIRQACREALSLIDWASSYGFGRADQLPMSAAAAASPRVVKFVDRFMKSGRNALSGYDASEGALFVLFLTAARRVARTVFVGSAPRTRGQGNRGVEDIRVRLGTVQPNTTSAAPTG